MAIDACRTEDLISTLGLTFPIRLVQPGASFTSLQTLLMLTSGICSFELVNSAAFDIALDAQRISSSFRLLHDHI